MAHKYLMVEISYYDPDKDKFKDILGYLFDDQGKYVRVFTKLESGKPVTQTLRAIKKEHIVSGSCLTAIEIYPINGLNTSIGDKINDPPEPEEQELPF